MARLAGNQRVVRSIPDRQGNVYTKTSAGGKARAAGAVRYMDQHERTPLYRLEAGELVEVNREEAALRVEESTSKYVQHLAFTTTLTGVFSNDGQGAAKLVAMSIQDRRSDADIYALAVHQSDQPGEPNLHVHVVFGTDTTLRQRGADSDLTYFREAAYRLERHLEREFQHNQHENGRENGRMALLDAEDRPKPQRELELQRGYDMDY